MKTGNLKIKHNYNIDDRIILLKLQDLYKLKILKPLLINISNNIIPAQLNNLVRHNIVKNSKAIT